MSTAISAYMVQSQTAAVDDPVIAMVPLLTNGHSHAVIITNKNDLVIGLISHTDLISALAYILNCQHVRTAKKPKSRLHLLRGAGI